MVPEVKMRLEAEGGLTVLRSLVGDQSSLSSAQTRQTATEQGSSESITVQLDDHVLAQ
jgi:hypothetical protein